MKKDNMSSTCLLFYEIHNFSLYLFSYFSKYTIQIGTYVIYLLLYVGLFVLLVWCDLNILLD